MSADGANNELPPNKSDNPNEFVKMGLTVVMLCFFMNMVSRGISETYSVFLPSIETETGWTRSALSAIGACYMVVHGLAAPLSGAAFDWFGPKVVYSLGLCIFGCGYLLASQMTQYWHGVFALGIMIGIGISATGMAATSSLISRWFDRQLTTAMGIAYAGLSVGMITMAPLAERLISIMGWRDAYIAFGVIMLALIPIFNWAPWRIITSGSQANTANPLKRTLFMPIDILKTAAFWGLFGVFFFTSIATWSIMLPLVSYLISLGMSPFSSALVYGFVGSASILGMITTAWLADKYGRKKIVTLSYCISITGVCLLALYGALSHWFLLLLFVLCFGITMGSRGPVVSTLVARLFSQNVGAVYGAITIGLGLGGAGGSLISGFLFDITGGYEANFIASIIASLLGLAPFWLIPEIASGRWRA